MKEKLTVEGVLKDWYAYQQGNARASMPGCYSGPGTGDDELNPYQVGYRIVERAMRRLGGKSAIEMWQLHLLDGGTKVSHINDLEGLRVRLQIEVRSLLSETEIAKEFETV